MHVHIQIDMHACMYLMTSTYIHAYSPEYAYIVCIYRLILIVHVHIVMDIQIQENMFANTWEFA
jgi:hypothetical protein